MVRTLLVLVLLGLGLPSAQAGTAVEHLWCVDTIPSNPSSTCGVTETSCENESPFGTVASALDAIRVADHGSEAQHAICVTSTASHVETWVVDDGDDALGGFLMVVFAGLSLGETNACPDPSSGPDEPLIQVLGPPDGSFSFRLRDLRSTASDCGGVERPLVSAADAELEVQNVFYLGHSGPLLSFDDSNQTNTRGTVVSSLFESFSGQAVVGTAEALHVQDSEFHGGSSRGEGPIVDLETGDFRLVRSGIFGCVVSGGAPLLRVVGRSDIRGSVIAGNVVGDNGDLLELQARQLLSDGATGIARTTISRNSLLAGSEVVPAAPAPRDPGEPPPSQCLPMGARGTRYIDREAGTGEGEPGTGALVRLRSETDTSNHFAVTKSFLVGNVSGAVFRVAGGDVPNQVSLMHSTVDPNGASLIDAIGSNSAESGNLLVLARNLFASPVTTSGAVWGHVEATFDEYVGGDADAYGALATWPGVAGPPLLAEDGDPAFLSFDEARTWSECAHLEELCDGLACEDATEEVAFCALDQALRFLPGDALAAAGTRTFPWTGEFFDNHPESTAGATGWVCDERHVPFDLKETGAFPEGDLDGFTTLTDCDNEDDEVSPVLPEPNGFTDPTCDQAEGVCYVCPKGTESDDDDATDDDDSALPDEDDASPGDDDDAGPPIEDCVLVGCGAGWRYSAVWLLGGLGLVTRRRLRHR